jgi:hypothetical protein
LQKVAKVNGKIIQPDALTKLTEDDNSAVVQKSSRSHYHLTALFRSLPMMLRLLGCSFCWLSVNFLFYGLSLNSVALDGNGYMNFMLTAAAEIPAYCAAYMILKRMGRRPAQAASFILTALACFGFIFIGEG